MLLFITCYIESLAAELEKTGKILTALNAKLSSSCEGEAATPANSKFDEKLDYKLLEE